VLCQIFRTDSRPYPPEEAPNHEAVASQHWLPQARPDVCRKEPPTTVAHVNVAPVAVVIAEAGGADAIDDDGAHFTIVRTTWELICRSATSVRSGSASWSVATMDSTGFVGTDAITGGSEFSKNFITVNKNRT